jgi:phosphoenolpyruvate synthase/pyruvate phosphate dikinase
MLPNDGVGLARMEFIVSEHIGVHPPANYPDIARYLAELGIDSISVNPSSIFRTMQAVRDAEAGTKPTQAAPRAAE